MLIDEKRFARSEEMVNAGTIPRGDLFDLKATVATDKQNIAVSENNLLISRLSLAQLLQLKEFADFDVVDDNKLEDQNNILAQSPIEIYDKAKEIRTDLKLAQTNLEIAEKNANKKLLANIKMAAFARLSNTELYTAKVRDYAFEAYETYKEILPENALDRVKATYVVGAVEYAEKHDDKAIPLLLEVVKQFDALNFSHPYALSAHAYLVELYERQGKRDESTAHCIAIGKMRPWADTQEQQPLFRTVPKYPKSYLMQRKSGYVTLNFTVDEMGFVKNPEVLESKGGVLFEKSTLKMIEEWRYAHIFEHGKPVAAQTTVRIDYFTDKS